MLWQSLNRKTFRILQLITLSNSSTILSSAKCSLMLEEDKGNWWIIGTDSNTWSPLCRWNWVKWCHQSTVSAVVSDVIMEWHHYYITSFSVFLLHHVFDVFTAHVLSNTELVWSVIKLLFAEQFVNIRTRYTINILNI